MSAKPPSELLYDSEATLRLVDSAIEEIGDLGSDDSRPAAQRDASSLVQHSPPVGPVGQSDLIAWGHSEILGVLDALRQSRHFLERGTQDLTGQQLAYASAVLSAMEARLTTIARAFESSAATLSREDSQAIADRIVAARRPTA
jgi:hypothetical protein